MISFIVFIIIVVVAAAAVIVLRNTWRKISQDQRRLEWLSSRQFVVLMIEVPRQNDKTPLAAEQMFASLHGIQQASSEFQEHVSFEIVAQGSSIRFFVFCPVHLRDFVEGQIYAQYPTVEIVKVDDYTRSIDLAREHIVGTELEMTKADVYPIKTFANFNVDPLAGITAPLAKLADNEQVWIQILMRPVDDTWQVRGTKLIEDTRAGKSSSRPSIIEGVMGGIGTLASDTIREAASPGSIKVETAAGEASKVSGMVESGLKGIEEKITKLGYATKIRVIAIAPDMYSAQGKVMSIVGAFKQFNTTNLNGFTAKQMTADSRQFFDQYVARSFEDNGLVLNIEELASLYHLPNITVETPNIVWTRAKKGEPPSTLPIVGQLPAADITRIGKTNFRNSEKEFGIKLGDRRRHTYVIGKSGTGKSTLLENMIIDDVNEGRGVILVDPHGETYEHVLAAVPEYRIEDVILFDPSDRMHPIGFNLLESVDEDLKGIVASGFVGIFEKMFSNSWGPRLEHILRNTVLALLDYPDSTMLGIPKMLTEKKYRQNVVDNVKDPVIRDFWENEFASWDQKFASEAVAPILNKVGQFIAAATIRNIVGQPKSTFDVRQVMDQGKILLINLSRGKIGEDNSAMLGAMMITKIQLAAMSRADSPEEQRTDSYLYVDEFQNFATRSFATILSEARKYHLNLIMANQYIAQMPEEVRDAVFGNVGTIIAFRVGAADASELVHEFTPEFTENDLVNQDIHKIYIKLSIDGLTGQAFSADTLRPIRPDTNFTEQIAAQTRQKYSRSREDVEREMGSVPGLGSVTKQSTALAEGTINLPPIKLSPRNIIDGHYYKELHSKGGVRWWEGEPLEKVIEDEEKKRQKFVAKKIEHMKNGVLNSSDDMDELLGEGSALAAAVPAAEPVKPDGKPTEPVDQKVGEREAETKPAPSEHVTQDKPQEQGSSAPANKEEREEEVKPTSDATKDDQEKEEEGSKPVLRSASYGGPATLNHEKNDHQQGTVAGERVQANNSGIIDNTSPTTSGQSQISLTHQNAPKNLINSLRPDLQAAADEKSHELHKQAAEAPKKPDFGHNELVVGPKQPQKALESSRTHENHPSGTNDRPNSILQHFMPTRDHDADKSTSLASSNELSTKEDDSQADARYSSTTRTPSSDELIEGVAQTF